MVGGGQAAQRRTPALLTAGADVVVVAPWVTPFLEGLVASGEVAWVPRAFEPGDLDDAWYAVAATDDRETNIWVGKLADERRVYSEVVGDPAAGSVALPSVGGYDGATLAVWAGGGARTAARLRDGVVDALVDGRIRDDERPEPAPGVVLVGSGPGDPGLLTLAGRRALNDAQVVVADRLVPRALIGELSPDVELVDVTKLPRGRAAAQEEINRVLVERAQEGLRVVRLKGGDSFVFGRGFEEAQACAEAGVAFDVVPGLSSALAVPAAAGIPLTHRGVAHEFTVASGHVGPDDPSSLVDWDALARLNGTLVLLMAIRNLPAIADRLVRGGRRADTPASVLMEGGLPGERRLLSTLGEVAADVQREGIRPPAVVVVGPVVGLAEDLRHFPGAWAEATLEAPE